MDENASLYEKGGTEESEVTLTKLSQSLKAKFSMIVKLSGRTILVKLLLFLKVEPAIAVTPSGMTILVKLLHIQKA